MKTLHIVALLLLCAAVGFGAPLCGSSTYSLTSAGWAEGCQSGDKEFTNFTYSAGTTGVATVSVGFAEEPTLNQHTVLFTTSGGSWLTGTFTLTYWVTVLNADPLWRVVAADLDSTIGGFSGTVTVTNTLSNGSGTTYATLTSSNGDPDLVSGLSLRTFLVTITGDVGAGRSANQVSDSYYQAEGSVPEPMTLALVGSGFLALGLLRRFRR